MGEFSAGKTVATLRMVNGEFHVDLPDDPTESGGPTRFTEVLSEQEVEDLLRALPMRARDRVHLLIGAHQRDVEIGAAQAHRTAEELEGWRHGAIRFRAAADRSRAEP